MTQQRIDELKGRLEHLRREVGEVEVLIQAYENAQKEFDDAQKEQSQNGTTKPKKEKVDAQVRQQIKKTS